MKSSFALLGVLVPRRRCCSSGEDLLGIFFVDSSGEPPTAVLDYHDSGSSSALVAVNTCYNIDLTYILVII